MRGITALSQRGVTEPQLGRAFILCSLVAAWVVAPAQSVDALDVPFGPPVTIAADVPDAVVDSDLNDDGHVDVVVYKEASGVAWYRNLGGDPPSFSGPHAIAGAALTRPVVKDLDGDGDLDVVTSDEAPHSSYRIVAYLNDGSSSPSFSAYPFSVPYTPESIDAADVDDDGDMDFVTATECDSAPAGCTRSVVWYENDGSPIPSFSANVIVTLPPTTVGPRCVGVADMDGDRDKDIFYHLNASSPGLFLLANDGAPDPAFANAWAHNSPHYGRVLAADVDGDGDRDLVAAGGLSQTALWVNDGGSPPSFALQGTGSPAGIDVEVEDMDRDGDLDLLSASPGGISWQENDGNTPIGFTSRTVASIAAAAIAAADMNGDGAPDPVVGSSTELSWIESFGPSWLLRGSAEPSFGFAVAGGGDINRDGLPDLLVTSRCQVGAPPTCEDLVELYLGSSEGYERSASWTAIGDQAGEGFGDSLAFVGDVNGDHLPDIAIGAPRWVGTCNANGGQIGRVLVWYGGDPVMTGEPTGLGAPGTPANADEILLPAGFMGLNSLYCGPSEEAFGSALLGPGDLDGDGHQDLVVGDPILFSYKTYPDVRNGYGHVHVFGGSDVGVGANRSVIWGLLGEGCEARNPDYGDGDVADCEYRYFGEWIEAGDVDGDGARELVIQVPKESRYAVFEGPDFSGAEESDYAITAPSAIIGRNPFAVADVNADGYDDVVIGPGASLLAYHGAPEVAGGLDGTEEWTYVDGTAGARFDVVNVGDRNADCFEDVAAARVSSSAGVLRFFDGEGSAQGLPAAASKEIATDWGPIAAAGDVGRDGFDDLLAANDGSPEGGLVALYAGSGSVPPSDCDGDGSRRGPDCDDGNSSIHPGAPELCDGLDNDCDFGFDEDFADLGDACAAGVGECQASGTVVCAPGGAGTVCDAIPDSPTTEVCDGLDNDCDGLVDEVCAVLLDQEQAQWSSSWEVGDVGGNVYERYQTFTVGVSGQLARVELLLQRGSVALGTPLVLEIWSVSGDAPGVLLATANFSSSDVPTSASTWFTLDMTALGVQVVEGEQYAIVVPHSAPAGQSLVWLASDYTDPYPGGNSGYRVNGGAWLPMSTLDHAFRTYVLAPVSVPALGLRGLVATVALLVVGALARLRREGSLKSLRLG